MRRRIAVTAIISVLGLIFMSQPVHAVAPLQLINVTPSSTSIAADPGGSSKQGVDIINVGHTPFKVSLTSSPYHVEGLNYDPKFTQLPGTVDASQWVHFTTPTTFTTEAQKLYSVDYTVAVPAGTAPGGYYAVLFATTDEVGAVNGGVVTHGRIGDILYITVNGPVKSAGNAAAIRLPLVVLNTPIDLSVIVGNQGGVHFQTTINTTVKNIFGAVDFHFSQGAYVLPQTERTMHTAWSPQAPIGIYRIERTATLPNGLTHLAAQTVVIVKPWVIIVLIVMIVVIVIMLMRRISRTSHQQKRKNDHEQ